VQKRVRFRRGVQDVGIGQRREQRGHVVGRRTESGGQRGPVTEMFGHHQFAAKLGGRHALQRSANAGHVPGVAAGVGDHVDLGAVQRPRDEVETLIAVGGGGRVDHAPGAQGHGGGADAEDGARTFAKHEGVHVGDAPVGVLQ